MVFFCWNVISIGSFHDTMTLKQLPIDFFTKITPSNIKYFFPLFPATNLYHVIICRSTNMLSHGWSPTWSFQEKKFVGITHDGVTVPQRTLYFKKNIPLVQQIAFCAPSIQYVGYVHTRGFNAVCIEHTSTGVSFFLKKS